MAAAPVAIPGFDHMVLPTKDTNPKPLGTNVEYILTYAFLILQHSKTETIAPSYPALSIKKRLHEQVANLLLLIMVHIRIVNNPHQSTTLKGLGLRVSS
jgi:hypothetical protein